MKLSSTGILPTVLCAALLWMICSPVTTGDGSTDELTVLILSLEEMGRKKAEFSGAPIEAIIELDNDTLFSTLQWHTGEGDPLFSDSVITATGKQFKIKLTWSSYPLVEDTADGLFYDTVYVSMGGGLKKSNKVVVNVTNLPVVTDSLLFDTVYFSGNETEWKYTFDSSVAVVREYSLAYFGHDFDGTGISLQVLAATGEVSRSTPTSFTMSYTPLAGDFIDTVTFVAYDQKGSQDIKRLILNRISPNRAPIIDSILVNQTLLKGVGALSVGFDVADSVTFRLYTHDVLGSVDAVNWTSAQHTITPDSTDQFSALWVCETELCSDITIDTTFVIDTVTVQAVDNRGDTTAKAVILYKGTINKPPEIETVTFGGQVLTFSENHASVEISGGQRYTIQLNAVDPEEKPVTVTWVSQDSKSLSEQSSTSAVYTAAPLRGTDTVTIQLSDSVSTVTYLVEILITDIGPIVDSITIADTVVVNPGSTIRYYVSPQDTFLVIIYCYDRDEQDTLSYTWEAKKPDRFAVRQSNRARYILPLEDLNDTIICTVQDGTVQTVRKIVLAAVNAAPVIDSIQENSVSLTLLSENEYSSQVNAADTAQYTAFGTDPEGGAVTYSWSATTATRLLATSGSTIRYASDSTTYNDTITISVTDTQDDIITKRIIIQVDTVETP